MPDTSLGLPPPDTRALPPNPIWISQTPGALLPNPIWINQAKATFRCCEAACSSDVGTAEISRV